MLDLKPIKARLAAATPGPWEHAKLQGQSRRNSFFSVAVVGRREVRAGIPCQAQPDERDADIIANAPTDLAALVAEVEALRLVEKALGGQVSILREAIAHHQESIFPGDERECDCELWTVLDA